MPWASQLSIKFSGKYVFFPLHTEDQALILRSFEGKWIFDFSEGDTLFIQKKGDNFYHFQTVKSSLVYEGILGKPGDILILQLFT
jgi:hypothetical protein